MIPTVIVAAPTFVPSLCPPGYAKITNDRRRQTRRSCLAMPGTQSKKFEGLQISTQARRLPYKVGICSSLNVRCAAEQTQTVKRQSSKITSIPSQVTKIPKVDDGGTGFPPKDGGGGGGGGGGGSSSSGGFFLFGFLLFLSYLRDQEEDRV